MQRLDDRACSAGSGRRRAGAARSSRSAARLEVGRRSRLRASKRSRPAYGPASSVIVPSSSMTVTIGRPWRWPISKSFGSWAGVTFTAPVPNAGSTNASAITGISRPTSGRRTRLPTRCAVALVVGIHRHGRVAEHRLGPRRRDHDVPVAVRAAGSACATDLPACRAWIDLQVGQRRAAARAPVDRCTRRGRSGRRRRA